MDIANRLESIEQEIRQVENEKLQCEQRLGLFWEHFPAIDPIIIQSHMLSLKNQIRSAPKRTARAHCAGCRHPPGELEDSVDSF
ncbi:hypothetical protein SLE2022_403640 [Rubroshorea leprosula]